MARSLGHDLLLHLFSRQRTEDKPYEGRAVETSSVSGRSSIMAAVDTTAHVSEQISLEFERVSRFMMFQGAIDHAEAQLSLRQYDQLRRACQTSE